LSATALAVGIYTIFTDITIVMANYDEGGGELKNGALLLFGKNPQKHFINL
jgi:predicted HTH transcriptional regulator